jgi:hypothetical protein
MCTCFGLRFSIFLRLTLRINDQHIEYDTCNVSLLLEVKLCCVETDSYSDKCLCTFATLNENEVRLPSLLAEIPRHGTIILTPVVCVC